MVWFKVDDGFAFHPKAMAAGNAALGLWVRAGSWCGKNLTDGALPANMIGTLGAQRRDALRLVAAGLWCETAEGFQFVDWDEWQPTKDQVKADREATKLRVQAFREKHRNGVGNAVTTPVTNAVSNGSPTRPDPTRTSYGSTEEGYVSSASDDFRQPTIQEEPRGKPISMGAARLSKIYCDRVKLSDRSKVSMVCMNATAAGYTDDQISKALTRLAEDNMPVTADTLRIEIDGKKSAYGISTGTDGVTRAPDGRPIAGKGWEES